MFRNSVWRGEDVFKPIIREKSGREPLHFLARAQQLEYVLRVRVYVVVCGSNAVEMFFGIL